MCSFADLFDCSICACAGAPERASDEIQTEQPANKKINNLNKPNWDDFATNILILDRILKTI